MSNNQPESMFNGFVDNKAKFGSTLYSRLDLREMLVGYKPRPSEVDLPTLKVLLLSLHWDTTKDLCDSFTFETRDWESFM